MAVNVKLLVAEIVGEFVVIGLVLFVLAGTISWAAGWVFLVLFSVFIVAILVWLYRYNPGLLKERMTGPTPDQKGWDKVLVPLLYIAFLVWLFLMPLDAARFHWSQMPVWIQGVGVLVLLCAFYLFFITFRENSYLSPVVCVQTDRGQSVISTGPYHFVRHPMYSGGILFFLGTTLVLGSWYGLLFGLILVGIIARRAVLEERALRGELQGYDAYITQVKYRLFPYVW